MCQWQLSIALNICDVIDKVLKSWFALLRATRTCTRAHTCTKRYRYAYTRAYIWVHSVHEHAHKHQYTIVHVYTWKQEWMSLGPWTTIPFLKFTIPYHSGFDITPHPVPLAPQTTHPCLCISDPQLLPISSTNTSTSYSTQTAHTIVPSLTRHVSHPTFHINKGHVKCHENDIRFGLQTFRCGINLLLNIYRLCCATWAK